ncbi:stage V sporulation protein AC [Fictibacillus phosphorivorans]|uniref:Stage V sporulation protein AC n=1 Tax=Fictibacillus phosphorivorans TaxID=1221500 RepID=A0A161RRD7_9BACL|nr:stage V sporulation protein AC [Fictibacillus phosphorivorans]KZE66303.1 stage V sporulation protein AC [Fictibacillus phosphorivorans]
MATKEEQQAYAKKIKPIQPKPPYVLNCLKAFLVGGLICVIGQAIQNFYMEFFNFSQETAGNPTVATLILIAALLTGLGVYDKIGQFAGAGSVVPVTGFANAVTSAALEHKSEGLVLGVATNLFKLAGAVIVFGAVAAYVFGMIRYIFQHVI